MAKRQYKYEIISEGNVIGEVILNSKDKRIAFKKAEKQINHYNWELSNPKMIYIKR